jgi:hypothetical protein
MLTKYLIAIFLRMIPESILLIKGAQLLAGKKGETMKVVYSGACLGTAIFFIRRLPISFGVHTILSLLLYIFILLKIFRIEFFRGVSVALICILILAFTDTVATVFYTKGFGISGEWLYGGSALAFLLSDLSLLLFVSIILLIKKIKNGKIHEGN